MSIHSQRPCSLRWWENNFVMRIISYYKVKFAIKDVFVNEAGCNVALLDACDVMFGSCPYLWERDALFCRQENKYCLVNGETYLIKAHKGDDQASLVTTSLGKKLIDNSQKRSTYR